MASTHVQETISSSSPGFGSSSGSSSSTTVLRAFWRITDVGGRLWFCVGLAALLAASAAEFCIPPLVSSALFAVVENQPKAVIFSRAATITAAGLACGAFNGVRGYAFHTTRNRVARCLRERAFAGLLAKEMGFFDGTEASELASRLTNDCQAVFTNLDDVLNFLLRSCTLAIFGVAALVRISPVVTAYAGAMLAVLMVATRWYGQVSRASSRSTQDCLAELSRISGEGLGLLRLVRALDSEAVHRDMYTRQNFRVFEVQRRRGRALGIFSALSSSLTLLTYTVALVSGGLLVLGGRGTMTAQMLTTYCMYLDMVTEAAVDLGTEWASAMDAIGSGEEVLAIANTEHVKPSGTRRLPQIVGDVRLSGVQFAYPMRPGQWILDDVSLHCRAGKVTAFVGVSGSGKSTAMSLMQRFYDPAEGRVSVDDVDLRELDLPWWRQQLGVVGQEPRLFRGTIAENIAWGLGDVSREQIREAARAACIDEFIEQLPLGYDTVVADGKLLSGGQRQLVAIARALLRDPPVLILDEPTSALDASASRRVANSLLNLRWSPRLGRERTVIMIAHRLSTVESVDHIVVFQGGRVVESGTHEELVALDGAYVWLLADQRLPTNHTPRI